MLLSNEEFSFRSFHLRLINWLVVIKLFFGKVTIFIFIVKVRLYYLFIAICNFLLHRFFFFSLTLSTFTLLLFMRLRGFFLLSTIILSLSIFFALCFCILPIRWIYIILCWYLVFILSILLLLFCLNFWLFFCLWRISFLTLTGPWYIYPFFLRPLYSSFAFPILGLVSYLMLFCLIRSLRWLLRLQIRVISSLGYLRNRLAVINVVIFFFLALI